MRHGYRITRVIVPAASMALVSLDDAKVALGIPAEDTSQDAALTAQIESVSLAICNWCDRIFAVQTYRDQLRDAYGTYGEALVTRQYPITLSETGVPQVAVAEDSIAVDAAMLEVYPEQGAVYRLDAGLVPMAWGSALIVVDYQAGFAVIPAPVQSACVEWLTARWSTYGRDPTVRSETIPDVLSQTYGSIAGGDASGASSIPMGTQELLMPYKVWTV